MVVVVVVGERSGKMSSGGREQQVAVRGREVGIRRRGQGEWWSYQHTKRTPQHNQCIKHMPAPPLKGKLLAPPLPPKYTGPPLSLVNTISVLAYMSRERSRSMVSPTALSSQRT